MHRPRFRVLLAGTGALTTVVTTAALLVLPPTASAEPDIDTVKAKVAKLYREAEAAQESYNTAKTTLRRVDRQLVGLRADQARQQRRVDAARGKVESSVVDQYEGQGVSAVGQVVVSDDPSTFLQGLTTMSAYNDLQTSTFGSYATELKALGIRATETRKRVKQAAALTAKLKKDKATVDSRYGDAKALLGRLEEKQRREIEEASRSGDVSRLPDVPVEGRAAAAVAYAKAQVGKSYVYGAAGPSAFDCSGLTMMAWAQAGVALPHSSSAQQGSGTRVSSGDLQPGDLVFYYSPVSHVGIYIGNGLIVNALNPGAGVKIQGVFSLPYSGAVRPG